MTGGFISNMFTSIGYGIFEYDTFTISNIAFWGPFFNGGARVLVGILIENKSYPMGFKAVCNLFFVLLLVGMLLITFVQNNIAFAIGVICVFIFLGATIVIPAIFMPRQLGAKLGSEV